MPVLLVMNRRLQKRAFVRPVYSTLQLVFRLAQHP